VEEQQQVRVVQQTNGRCRYRYCSGGAGNQVGKINGNPVHGPARACNEGSGTSGGNANQTGNVNVTAYGKAGNVVNGAVGIHKTVVTGSGVATNVGVAV